ncbi:MAG TPA: OmpH family outer membrane protein [Bryobacteraceae bacterium]|nr:OmpH family outer membrane protein [Bryobacteraceae bacterium]
MKKNCIVFSAFAVGLVALAQAQSATPSKVAIIHVQNAILQTKDGQKAQQELQVKFNPRKQQIEKKQADIAALQDQMKKGSATMSDDAKTRLARDIDTGQKSLQRDSEDFEADVNQEEQRIMQDLGQKMMDVIIKYATQNSYAMVVDVSNPQTPVLWADPGVDITNEIIKLYDQAHSGTGASAPAPAPVKAPAPAASPRKQ